MGALLSRLAGHASISFHHAQSTLLVLPKGGKEERPLSDLVKSTTPECWLNPFLFNGHLQTIWASRGTDNPDIKYKRKVFEAENPAFAGSFAVDFVTSDVIARNASSLPTGVAFFEADELEQLHGLDDKPMLVCLHGLAGGSHEIYLRKVLQALTTVEGGWEACVINARGCARSKITTDVIFNARATWDVRQLVKWLRHQYPNRPLYAIGFSLGANILTNYVGEEGDECLLKAAISVANPWNLEVCDHALRSTWMGLKLYTKAMGASMRKLISHQKDMLGKSSRFDYDKVMATTYLYEFDRELQCPTWGYPTEGAYYRDASSTDALCAVRIPFLGLDAEDDPVNEMQINGDVILANHSCQIALKAGGGHLGWFEYGGGRWYVKPVIAFLQAMQQADDSHLSIKKQELSAAMRQQNNPIAAYMPTRRKLWYFHES